jgi:hypothetical protein
MTPLRDIDYARPLSLLPPRRFRYYYAFTIFATALPLPLMLLFIFSLAFLSSHLLLFRHIILADDAGGC